jgi:hypothetical protein
MAKAIWAKVTWHAYYFNSLDRTSPVARTAIIEADNEEEAGKNCDSSDGALHARRCRPPDVGSAQFGNSGASEPDRKGRHARERIAANIGGAIATIVACDRRRWLTRLV